MSEHKAPKDIKEKIKDHYAKAINLKVQNVTDSLQMTSTNSCCSSTDDKKESTESSCCSPQPVEFDKEAAERFAKMAGYTDEQLADMPGTVSSFGCGNPVAFMKVKPGEVVLDLGSGSGLDLILAAKKVGDTGKAIGLDMTDAMIDVCRKNLVTAGIKNAEVRKGEMEKMPVVDSEVDWIISNCVINLSPEKEQVFAEAFRVLKPGGQVMVSDIVTIGLPDEFRSDIGAWVGCIAGAVEEDEYISLMQKAGFTDVEVTEKLVYDSSSLAAMANDNCGCGTDGDRTFSLEDADKYAGKVATVRVYAKKPGGC